MAKFRHLEFSTRPALAAGKDGKDGKDGKAKRSEWKQAIHYLAGETAAMDSYGRFFSIKMDQHGMNVFFLYWQWGMNAFFLMLFSYIDNRMMIQIDINCLMGWMPID